MICLGAVSQMNTKRGLLGGNVLCYLISWCRQKNAIERDAKSELKHISTAVLQYKTTPELEPGL